MATWENFKMMKNIFNKEKHCCCSIYNDAHNILRHFDGCGNFAFTASETKPDY